jgi:hypothetical protein
MGLPTFHMETSGTASLIWAVRPQLEVPIHLTRAITLASSSSSGSTWTSTSDIWGNPCSTESSTRWAMRCPSFSANDDVQVNVEAEAHFPHEAFVEPEDAWYACGNLPDPGCNVRVRCNVGELQDSRPQLVPCVVQNNDCCTKCSPAVGRFPPWPSYQSYGDAKKCKRRGYRVTAVMPCVAL